MQEPWKVGVRRGENRLIQSLCGEQLDPTGSLLHLEKRKGLFAKATSSEGLWIQSPAAKEHESESKNT